MSKIILFLFTVLSFSACNFFDKEEEKPLLSQIDGEAYYELHNGKMNTQKACLYILEGKKDSVNYNLKIDLLDSLEVPDKTWRDKYFKAINIVIEEIKEGQPERLEKLSFAYFLHYPKEFIDNLNNVGFDNIDNWMDVMNLALKKAIEPKDITATSVINASLSNCKQCNKNDKQLIIRFIKSLENYN